MDVPKANAYQRAHEGRPGSLDAIHLIRRQRRRRRLVIWTPKQRPPVDPLFPVTSTLGEGQHLSIL